jgi:hypothetical protein
MEVGLREVIARFLENGVMRNFDLEFTAKPTLRRPATLKTVLSLLHSIQLA